MSFVSSCSCSALVAVATTTRLPETSAGKQVGEALPRPGPRLREQVLAPLERVGDLLCERTLLGPGLEAGKGASEPPAGAEVRVHGTSESTTRSGQHSERVFLLD